jgi:hypothetical protein
VRLYVGHCSPILCSMKIANQRSSLEITGEEPLPPSCSKICQCSYLPINCTRHQACCSVDISRMKRHTHVLIMDGTNAFGTIDSREQLKLCVSPKCISTQEAMCFERIPERDCQECYNNSLKIQQLCEEEARILLHKWRISRPKPLLWAPSNLER